MTIVPEYRLMLKYDIHPDRYEAYFHYVSRKFVPKLRELGLHAVLAWQVHSDHLPERQLEFVTADKATMRDALLSDAYQQAETHLKTFTTHFERKVVRFDNRFQF